MKQTEQIAELAAALAKAQAEMRPAVKGKINPHFKSKYADLDACWDAARGPLARNGLAVTQWPRTEGKSVTITTTLVHASGQWQSGELTMAARDETPQSIGSTITYGRRYGFCAAVGITSDEDDDGNAGSENGRKARIQAVQQAVPDVYAGTDAHKDALRAAARAVGVNPQLLPQIHDAFLASQVDIDGLENAIRKMKL